MITPIKKYILFTVDSPWFRRLIENNSNSFEDQSLGDRQFLLLLSKNVVERIASLICSLNFAAEVSVASFKASCIRFEEELGTL